MLPHEFPALENRVYNYFRLWIDKAIWHQSSWQPTHHPEIRLQDGRDMTPSCGFD